MRIIPVFIPHEGCPHDCVFCNQRRIAAPVSPKPEEVREQVCTALKTAGAGAQVAFYGGSFTAIAPEKQEAYLASVKGLPVSIRVSTRPDAIDEETLARLQKYGVKTIELGAQSMSDAVLARAGRGHSAEDTRRACRLIRDFGGFELILQLMCGLPGDEDTRFFSAREAAKLHPDGVRIYPVVVVRETALYDLWKAGQYTPLTVDEGARTAAQMLEVFIEADIPVLRIGLNPTEELSSGGAAAGAYHPALGEMARSYVYLSRILAAAGAPREGKLTVYVNQNRLSQAIGVKRANLDALRRLGYTNVSVKGRAGIGEFEVVLDSDY